MASVPSSEDVTTYLNAHSLEQVIEEAVNDAVLKQVKNPFEHIAELLMKHHQKSSGTAEKRRVSYDADAPSAGTKPHAQFSAEATTVAAERSSTLGGGDSAAINEDSLAREFVKKDPDAKLSEDLTKKLKVFFDKMDLDGDGTVTKDEAIKFWGKNFAKVNANSMFHEVDEDGNEQINQAEFMAFWQNVIASGYPEDDVLEEVDMMMEGGSWVDFNDGRTT
jgi:hypothetical protein